MSTYDKLRSYLRLSRGRTKESSLPFIRQWAEMLLLFGLDGTGPGYYQMAGFWRRSVTWREKRSHLSRRRYVRTLSLLNDMQYRKISQHKLAEKSLLHQFGLPTPRFIGWLHPMHGMDTTGDQLRGPEDLARLIDNRQLDRICFKLMEGWAGKGFELIDVQRSDTQLTLTRHGDHAILTPEQFCRERAAIDSPFGSVIEEYLNQHPTMAIFNPTSVNTYRIWVAQDVAGVVDVILAYLRLGREGSIVDNQSAGGLVAPITLSSGMIGAAIDGLPTRNKYSAHPDHGASIAGSTAPFFEEAKDLACRCLSILPEIRFAGCDIAVSQDGPVVLEVNVSPDREGAVYGKVPSAKILEYL